MKKKETCNGIFFDTSALIKRYIAETGSENAISKNDYSRLNEAIQYDFKFFNVLSFNQEIESLSVHLIEKHQLKTLDSIQLASCLSQKGVVNSFIVSDKKLKQAAKKEKLAFVDPTKS